MKKKIVKEEEEVIMEEEVSTEHPDISEQHRVMVEKAAELQKIAQERNEKTL